MSTGEPDNQTGSTNPGSSLPAGPPATPAPPSGPTQPPVTPNPVDSVQLKSALYWEMAAKNLMPDKTLERVTDQAKYVVTTVSVVGSLVSGLGIFTVSTVDNTALNAMAFLVLVLSTAAVCLALSTLVTRMKPVAPGNLRAVEEFYKEEIDRKKPALVAGVLLVVAAGIAGLTALVAGIDVLIEPDVTNRAALSTVDGDEGTVTVSLSGTIEHLDEQAILVRVISSDETLLLSSLAYPDEDGTVELDATISKVTSTDLVATADLYRVDLSEVDGGTPTDVDLDDPDFTLTTAEPSK